MYISQDSSSRFTLESYELPNSSWPDLQYQWGISSPGADPTPIQSVVCYLPSSHHYCTQGHSLFCLSPVPVEALPVPVVALPVSAVVHQVHSWANLHSAFQCSESLSPGLKLPV